MRAPTLGRSVFFTLAAGHVAQILAHRVRSEERVVPGTQVHTGNTPIEGDVVPGIIVKTWGSPGYPSEHDAFNVQLFLDGSDTLWVTSVQLAESPTVGYAHWWDWSAEPKAEGESDGIPVRGAVGVPFKVGDTVYWGGGTNPLEVTAIADHANDDGSVDVTVKGEVDGVAQEVEYLHHELSTEKPPEAKETGNLVQSEPDAPGKSVPLEVSADGESREEGSLAPEGSP